MPPRGFLLLVLIVGPASIYAGAVASSLGGTSTSHVVAGVRNKTVQAIADLQPASPGSPCLLPSAADNSATQIQGSGANVSLPGNVVPDVQNGKASYKSKLVDSFTLHMQLVFKLRNENPFEACLASLSDPASSNYGHFLNATTLQPYLPTPGQKVSVSSYFMKRGFTVTEGTSPIVIDLTANAGEVSGTLGVKMGFYGGSGKSGFFAPDSDPKLPQNLAVLVNGIMGLDNYTSIRPGESPCSGPYCPQGIQVGYGLSGLYASGYDGTGQKVAIVNEPGDPDIQTAINTYNTQYGLPPITLDIRYPDGTTSSYDPSWASETAMDVEAVHATAPGAGIVLLYDTDPMSAINYVATNNLAKIVSNSWRYICSSPTPHICSDTQLTSSFVSSIDSFLALDTAQGLTILFASGDEGAKPDGSNLGTEFPASDPNVLAVGATNLALTACSASTCAGYGSETGATISGGGFSDYFTEPSWQTSNIGAKSGRAVPDVSMLGYNPGVWVYSTASDKCGLGGNSAGWFSCAGTSLSTPLWAGFLAIVLQIKGGGSFGNIGPRLYETANSPSYSTLFHDVTSGLNNGYSAAVGWDPVTGWGTPIANNLAFALVQVSITITSSPFGSGYVNVDGTGISTPATFTWAIGSGHSLVANSLVSCGAGCQYVWQSWSDGGAQSHTITAPTTPTTYTATFRQQFMLTTSVNPPGGGTVSVSSGWQDAGTTVPVSETSNPSYSFFYWALDGTNVGSSSSHSVLMSSAHVLTANFLLTSSISLTVSSPSITLGHSVTLSGAIAPSQASGTMVTLTYSSDSGSTWSVFITTQTGGAGGYSVAWSPPYAGTYQLKASWSGNTNCLGASSPIRSLSVTGTSPSQIALLVAGPSSAPRGASVTFDVPVTNPGTSLSTTFYLEVTGPGGYEYFDTLTVTLPASGSGRYQFTWQIPTYVSSGSYQIVVGTIPPASTSISQTQISIT